MLKPQSEDNFSSRSGVEMRLRYFITFFLHLVDTFTFIIRSLAISRSVFHCRCGVEMRLRYFFLHLIDTSTFINGNLAISRSVFFDQ